MLALSNSKHKLLILLFKPELSSHRFWSNAEISLKFEPGYQKIEL